MRRRIALAMLVAAGFGLIGASGVSAAPANGAAIAEVGHQADQVIQVRESCGPGRHRNWGHCVPGCGPGWFQPYPEAHCLPRDGDRAVPRAPSFVRSTQIVTSGGQPHGWRAVF
jgi:hypothetical protein